jgi:hypothetical protein
VYGQAVQVMFSTVKVTVLSAAELADEASKHSPNMLEAINLDKGLFPLMR